MRKKTLASPDSTPHPVRYLVPDVGRGKELMDLLRRELQVPSEAKSFSVHFAVDEVVMVRCEYMPKG